MQQLSTRTGRPFTLALTALMLLAFAFCASCAPGAAVPAAATAAGESSPVPDVSDVPTAPAAAAPYSAELSLACPSGLAAGDLLLAQVCYKGGADVAVEAPSSAWIPVLTTVSESGAGIASFYAFVADPSAEPDAYAFRITAQSADGGTIPAAVQILRYSGIDPSDPIAACVGCNGGGDAPYADGLTTDAPGVVVALFGATADAQIDALSPDMAAMRTLCQEFTADGLLVFAADQDWASGAFGKRALSDLPSGAWASQLISLRFAAADATFLAGDHGTLTAAQVPSVSVRTAGRIASGSVPLVNAYAGYEFLCWRGDDGKQYYDAAALAESALRAGGTFTAQYKKELYRVTFNLGDSGTSSDTLVFADLLPGETITVPTVTPNEGFSFVGWDVEPAAAVYADADYFAQYEALTYTVTFDLGGLGTSTDALELSGLHIGDPITVPEVTANPGYIFNGWIPTPLETCEGDAYYFARIVPYRPK